MKVSLAETRLFIIFYINIYIISNGERGIHPNCWKLTRKKVALDILVNTQEDEVKENTSQLPCACNVMQLCSTESLTQMNSLSRFRWWVEISGRNTFLIFSTGSEGGSNLLSLGTTGLEVPPAEVLPTGLECLGPRPGIFSPLDLSIFILQ